MDSADCIFCKIINRELPGDIVFETKDILVIKDKFPKAPLHYLIMPKQHIKDISSLKPENYCLASRMMEVAQTLSQEIPEAASFKFVINNGYQAGQRIFHLHAHFVAGTGLGEL